jgi:hypothetical protein
MCHFEIHSSIADTGKSTAMLQLLPLIIWHRMPSSKKEVEQDAAIIASSMQSDVSSFIAL